jgi:putative hydrolase
MLGQMEPMLAKMSAAMFGLQVGQAVGTLATETISGTEVGLPLVQGNAVALVPANIAAFAEGLEVPLDEVRLYLALREAAHQRLFTHVPWLKAHLYDAVDAYARGIEVDPQAIERAVSSFDPDNPSAVQEALAGGMFELESTPAQQSALARLELALALVEGWVDQVVDQAASTTLPHSAQLRETIRRRRASGGPAEQTFATLVGLQLRPRRLREAAQLWADLTAARGIEGRDALWAHPDLLPGSGDLDDPAAWIAGAAGPDGLTDVDGVAVRDWDAGLQALGDEPPGPVENPDAGPSDR